jgi:hypothetical protein
MARIAIFILTAVLAVHWGASASAQNTTNKTTTSSNTTAKSNTSTPSNTGSNTSAPAQRINNIVNYNSVKVNQNPGPVNRITPSGTQAMTPNAQSQYGRGLRTNSVPSPTNPNARYNTQGRNVNPTGDKKIAAGFDANQKRYQANQSKPKPTTTTTASTTRSWPGPTRPTTTASTIQRSTATASAPVRPTVTAASRPTPPPPPSRTYTTSSSSSTATSNTNKKP